MGKINYNKTFEQLLTNGTEAKCNDLSKLRDRLRTCTLCKELTSSRNCVVAGYGDFNARVIFVGEAPGRLGADVTGVPFTRDRSGVLLQKMLCKISLNQSAPEDELPNLQGAYITNVVRCNPRGKNDTNRPPTLNEIANCSVYLKKEIEIIRPKLVVTLGVLASKVVLGDEYDSAEFGRIMQSREEFFVMPLWHPAYIIRGGGRRRINQKIYSRFFLKIKRFLSKLD